MNANPYQPPTQGTDSILDHRRHALRDFHVSLAMLGIPAVYNVICFNYALSFNQIQVRLSQQDRLLNLAGFLLLMVFLWFYGAPLLERETKLLNRFLATHSSVEEWNLTLYAALRRAPPLAMLGSLLWVIWIVAYYQLGMNFFLISLPIGLVAHLLAAFFYVPLILGWYRAERAAKNSDV